MARLLLVAAATVVAAAAAAAALPAAALPLPRGRMQRAPTPAWWFTAPRSKVFDVTQFGAMGDNKTDDTAALQRAIDAAGAFARGTGGREGATVRLPAAAGGGAAAVYRSGALWLRSHVTLEVMRDATLQGAFDGWASNSTWRTYPPAYVRSNGYMQMAHAGLVNGANCTRYKPPGSLPGGFGDRCASWAALEDVEILGPGSIDGGGWAWWPACPEHGRCPDGADADNQRPMTLQLHHVSGLRLGGGLRVLNAAFWSTHYAFCRDVIVEDVHVRAPPDSTNTDAFHPDSTSNVLIAHVTGAVGDDNVAVSSGKDADGRAVGVPSRNITTRNSHFGTGHGLSLGSGTSGGISDVAFVDCSCTGTHWCVRVKSMRGRGGTVERVLYDNIHVRNAVDDAVRINMYYHKPTPPPTNSSATPVFRDITVKNVFGTADAVGFFRGLPESPIERLTLDNVHVRGTSTKPDRQQWQCEYVHGVTHNVKPAPCF